MNIEEFEKKYQEIVKRYAKAIKWDLDELDVESSNKSVSCVYTKSTGVIDWYEFGVADVLVSNDEVQCVVDMDCKPYSVEEYLKDCEDYFSNLEKEMLASV